MTIRDKLDASKDGLDALLTYANGVTGQEDVSIGDAIKTLADGYGKGGDNEVEDSIVSGSITEYENNRVINMTRPYTFRGCNNLTKIVMRNLESCGTGFLQETINLVTAILPKLKTYTTSVLGTAVQLKYLDCSFPSIGAGFSTKANLSTVVLRSNTVCVPSATYFLLNATIYVPMDMLPVYKAHTAWSELAEKIYAIEDNLDKIE